ncbi:MAG: sodium:solute symporter [Sedimentisphaeraceae bacterium JB056]
MDSSLVLLDWVVLGAYFFILGLVVWWSSKKQDTSEDYFLAGRNIGWFAVGASLFASNIGSEHIVGLAGSGATRGMAMAHWELHAWIMMMLAWVFVPFYYRSGVFTMPEFLEKRFDSRTRWLLSCVSLVAYVFTKVSVTVYAGAKVFEALLPDLFSTPEMAFWVGAFTTVILTGVYTIFGGLRAVVYTDTAQAMILLVGSAFITYFGLNKLGGWGQLQDACQLNAANMALWNPLTDPDFPWLGVMIASPIVGIWYWCTDQYIVQRTLAAKNLTNARRGALWGGFLKVWPVFIFLVPGMIGYALHKNGLISIPLKDNGNLDGDQVFSIMVMNLLPVGVRGLVVGGLLAALMSSLSSLFNSCASLFTVDIYEKIKPGQSEKHLVTVGRFATGIVVGLGILWIPVMYRIADGGLYEYLQSVQSYLAPPITAVFLLGLFWKRINRHGAFWGLTVGFVLGMIKLTVQAFYGAGKIGNPAALAAVGDFNFLYFSGVLFIFSVILVIFISLNSKEPAAEKVAGLTFQTFSAEDKKAIRESWGKWDVLLTVATISLVIGIYLYFSFWI